MCGRYGLYDVSESELLKVNSGYTFKPNYNAAPTQSMPVITADDNAKKVSVMQWGITRRIGPEKEKSIFNTRSEKALDRFWGKTVKTNRCLVPANGFYEWKASKNGKIPYWISMPGSKLIYFAGIFDTDKEGQRHYSIMTTGPNSEMQHLHDRMPVILSSEGMDAWLYSSPDETDLLSDLLHPLVDNSLKIQEVSKEVNLVRNNHNRLMQPINSQ